MTRIALASPPFAGTVAGAMRHVEHYVSQASSAGAQIVCFPETCVPGLRGQGFEVEPVDRTALLGALDQTRELAATHCINVIAPMEWPTERGLLNLAFVVSASGALLGRQTKNQIAPEEDDFYVPGQGRRLFQLGGTTCGIAICHEGWRYPETVRWAAVRGARIVFHPEFVGSEGPGRCATTFGDPASPYFEKAMVCRALENDIYFASVNHATRCQEVATAVINPDGSCAAHLPYGEPGLLVHDIDPSRARRLYARRLVAD